jgi:hypothetical protein
LKGKKMQAIKIDEIIHAARNIQPVFSRKPETRSPFQWDSPVRTAELLTPNGRKSGLFGVIADTEQGEIVVGQYRKGDTLTSNADLVAQAIAGFDSLGLKTEFVPTVWGDGSRFTATFSVVSDIGISSLLHSPIRPEIKLANSYDGTWKKALEMALKILACLNGAESVLSGASMAIKHSRNSLGTFSAGIAGVIEGARAEMPRLEMLAEMPLDDEKAVNLFANIAQANSSKNAISDKTALTMLSYYFAPDENETSLLPSVWRAYMAGTRAMRDLHEVRPSQALAANQALGRAMGFALSNPKQGSAYLHGHSSPYAALVAAPKRQLIELAA